MGNSCTCITEEQKDRDEFKSVQTGGAGTLQSTRLNRDEKVVMIQKNYRGHLARKQYAQMKKEATQGTIMVEYLNENDILLNPMIKVGESFIVVTLDLLGNK